MNDKNFINFHVLISHSPSCLNRDDMNMQKTAVFGGVQRVRISSQSLKRAMRTSDYYRAHLGEASVRTDKLAQLKPKFVKRLAERYPASLVEQAIDWISGKEGTADADAVAPWSVDEVAHFCDIIQQRKAESLDSEKLRKQIEKDAQPFRAALASSIDIALSGRMATSGLMSKLPVDGALAVAHALTTHAVEPQDVDWFTAVDDLVVDAGDVGAGHLDTQQFSAGVFYRYASLNIDQLRQNMGGTDRARALEIARHVFHMLATIVPSAKQQSFAAHNLADFAIVSFADQPISLANAFEVPVKREPAGGNLPPSIRALAAYWKRMNDAYALDERAAAFNPDGVANGMNGMRSIARLPEIEEWIKHGGQD